MARTNKPQLSLDTIFFVTPEQKLLRFLITEPTTAFTPRVLSSKLKGVRGLGGVEGITKILKSLQELGLVIFLNNNREVCLQNDHPSIQLLKTFCAISDLEGLKQMIEPMSSKGVLFGSRATGKARSDSNYNLLVVSETPEEIKKVTSRHPLGKKLEPMVLTPDEFNTTSGKNKELSKQFDDGIHLWGSAW
jgi:hypothetical protein